MGNIAITPIAADYTPKIVYAEADIGFSNYMNQSITDTNWNVNRALLTHIIVKTESNDWTLKLLTHSDGMSGIYGDGITVAKCAGGNKVISLNNLPYIDASGTKSIHLYLEDQEWDPLLHVQIFGVKAR